MSPQEQTALADFDARLTALETKVAAAEQLAAKNGAGGGGSGTTEGSVAATDRDFRAGTSRDGVSGDGAPDRRP